MVRTTTAWKCVPKCPRIEITGQWNCAQQIAKYRVKEFLVNPPPTGSFPSNYIRRYPCTSPEANLTREKSANTSDSSLIFNTIIPSVLSLVFIVGFSASSLLVSQSNLERFPSRSIPLFIHIHSFKSISLPSVWHEATTKHQISHSSTDSTIHLQSAPM